MKHHSKNDKLFELTRLSGSSIVEARGCHISRYRKGIRVWHIGLRYEMLHINSPALLLRWISSFLRDRTVKVSILGHTSREIAINYGAPQGSPISPLLFLLYMSKLPKLLPNTRRSLFAADFMIYSVSSITRSGIINLTFKPLWMT